MPQGTPFHGFIPPFPIRVDQFGALPRLTAIPALHLLSHTHSDHVLGLSAKSFASTIICSPDAKQMLLRHEVYGERLLRGAALRDEARLSRTFGHLRVPPFLKEGKLDFSASLDLLKTLPIHTPTKIELSDRVMITLTLFDANHCPGAVMFLVEGAQGAVLHTGDFRAEPWFLDDIRRNPFLQPYLALPEAREGVIPGKPNDEHSGAPFFKTLDAIFLDTECLLNMDEVPTKGDATQGLVSLVALFPPETTFFINSWTWGYEDIFRALARTFRSQIHVDRYKHNIYSHLTDPFLRSLITLDPSQTRFHACERFNRCPHASRDDVVYINPVAISKSKWDQYLALTESKLRAAQPVTVLLVPLLRHSPLKELREFVSLFRPVRVVPNSLDPSLHGLDALCIPHLFANCLSSPQPYPSPSFARPLVEGNVDVSRDHNDAALQNLVGDGADSIARTWGDSRRIADKLAVMEPSLRGTARDVVRRTLGMPPLPTENGDENECTVSILQRVRDAQSLTPYRATEPGSGMDTESGDDDAHTKTAEFLFGIAGRTQIAGSEGMSQGQTQSSESPQDGCPPVEEGNSEVSMPPPVFRASPLLTPESGSQQVIGKSNTRRRLDSNIASLHTQQPASMGTKDMHIWGADHQKSSLFRAAAHTPSLPSLTLPAGNRSHIIGRDDPHLTDLLNIPLTGAEREHVRSQSRSHHKLSSSIRLHFSDKVSKWHEVEKWPDIHAKEDESAHMSVSSRRETVSVQREAAVEAGNLTTAQTACMEGRGLDVDGKARRAQRRALCARSRAIEEKLRHALPVHANSATDGLFLG